MSSHIAHESTLDVGLVDGCPRCAEHARDPVASLDSEHLSGLWDRMLDVEYRDPDARYRSETEAAACRVLYGHARFLRRVGVDPQYVTPR